MVDFAGPWMREMPKGTKPLTTQIQDGVAVMWALVNPDAPKVPRHFTTVGTGHDMPEDAWDWTYIGTFNSQGVFVAFSESLH